ncbi:hypothetical protein [Flavobacterium sp.]|uniref:XkdF-like putative serine protease domain-containing protein n=1 Tax=Flavobacterium sp. TaxID=239 RepID=UPI0033402336
METFEVIFNEGQTDGVFGISLVETPAIESNFIALSKQKQIKLSTIDNEKRLLLGAVLVPDLEIYRNQNGHEFFIKFSKETIRKSMENFFKMSYQQNSSLEHDKEIEGVTFVESWIKEDDVHDKSVQYGMNEPIGTWYATMKVDNDVIWNDYVKTGQVKGFSIDGMFDLEKINLTQTNMNLSEQITNAIKSGFDAILNKTEQVEIKMAQMKLIDGVTILEAESFEPGQAVFIVAENGDLIPAPIGEHELEDNTILVIVEEGIIAEIKVKEEVETEDEVVVEEEVAMSDDATEKLTNLIKEMMMQFSKQIATEIETIKNDFSKQIEEVKLSKEVKPSVKFTPETTQVVEVNLTKKQRILKNVKNLNN